MKIMKIKEEVIQNKIEIGITVVVEAVAVIIKIIN